MTSTSFLHLRRTLFKLRHRAQFARLQLRRREATQSGYTYLPFDRHRCIFVHIPKCAGVSVSTSLFGNLSGGHTTIGTYQIVFSPAEFRSYFKFTIVRNPWDRLLSAFMFLKSDGMNESDRRWATQHLSPYDTFDAFVRGWLTPANVRKGVHFRPQVDFLCVRRSAPLVDFLGYFENLDEDFSYICAALGVASELPRLNDSKGGRRDYKTNYTAETQRIVAQVYADDVRVLGYSFDNAGFSEGLAARRSQAGFAAGRIGRSLPTATR